MYRDFKITLLLVLPSLLPRMSTAYPARYCRCFPGDSCWPTDSDWAAFNQTVGGRLVATLPVAHVCHGAAYDPEQCTSLQARWNRPETHYTTSSSIMAPYFANRSCDPFTVPSAQCVIGTYVQYAVNASQVSDYQNTIRFSQRRNVRLVIRNTGHDYLGKSTGAGGLALWTQHIKNVQVLDYTSLHYNGSALRLGAGALSSEAMRVGYERGLVTVGGNCPTVGIAGGYTQGGGIGPLSSMHGLSADQVLEWQVVTASGELLTATPAQNEDLYWALSGGGGGTYGVVWALTVKAYADGPTTGANLAFGDQGVSQDTFYGVVKTFIESLPALNSAGAVSIWTITNTSFTLAPATGPGMTKTQMDNFMRPTLVKLQQNNMSYTYFSSQFSSYLDNFNAMNPPPETGYFQIGGRLIPHSLIAHADNLVQAIRVINAYGAGIGGLSFNASKRPVAPNSLNPAWRASAASITIGAVWNDTDWAANLANQNLMTDTLVPALTTLLPDGGSAYLNEADFREPDWQRVFYGSSYGGLKAVKEKYDPEDLFYGKAAVGSEEWEELDDHRLCKA